MKLMIASDIHGSAYYCRQMIAAYLREQADRLLLLGDILYHGPRNDLPREYDPKQVIDLLNPLKKEILCVRGNCDSEVDQMVLEFPIMSDYAFVSIDGVDILATHGHVYPMDKLPPVKSGDYVIMGHTHVPVHVDYGNFTHLNPGSISIPKNDSPHSYMILENGKFSWKDLDGKEFKVTKTYK